MRSWRLPFKQTKPTGLLLEEKLGAQFKQKYSEAKAKFQEELSGVNERLSAVQQELEVMKGEKSALEQKVAEVQQQAQAAPAIQEASIPTATENDESALAQELESVKRELDAVTARKAEMDTELETMRLELAAANTQRDEALAQAPHQQTNGVDAIMQEAPALPPTAPAGLFG